MKLILIFSLILVLPLLSACTTHSLQVSDREICTDLGRYGAHCAHVLSSGKRDILLADWNTTRLGWFCMNPEDAVEIEKELDQACVYLQCDYRTRHALRTATKHLHNLKNISDQVR